MYCLETVLVIFQIFSMSLISSYKVNNEQSITFFYKRLLNVYGDGDTY